MLRKIKKRIDKAIDNPKMIILYIASKGLLNWIPSKPYLKLLFYASIGKKFDIDNPITFNQKLQWLKMYDRNPLYTQLVDKYEVRKYIANTIGEQHLIPLLGVYNSFDQIDFNKLPNEFVLKCTHDSGSVVICKDKKQLDIKATKTFLEKNLRRNYYPLSREYPYKNVKPRIICEKFMVDETGIELKDYKFMCFNGVVKCSFVCLNRNSPNGLNVDFYDMNWNLMPFARHYPSSGTILPKPYNYEKMVKYSEKLSKNMPFVRVDFYETNGQLYFGELTFHPGSGFEEFTPESYDYLLGSWLELPSKVGK